LIYRQHFSIQNLGGAAFGGIALEGGDIRAVDTKKAGGLQGGNGEITNEIVSEDVLEISVALMSKKLVEVAGLISGPDDPR
jgi:hypothetical protein